VKGIVVFVFGGTTTPVPTGTYGLVVVLKGGAGEEAGAEAPPDTD